MKKSKKKPVKTLEQKIGEKLRDKAQIKAQIAARVAKAPREQNEVKKVYAFGSPGDTRKRLGITLTTLKKGMNETSARVTVMLNDNGEPTGETVTEVVRDTAAITKRRRRCVQRGLLGASSKTAKQRRKNNRYAPCNSKGTKRSKKGSSTGAPSTSSKKAA